MSKKQKPPATTHHDPATPAPQPDTFPIVGIGASAGGLEAFTELLQHLPLDTGMAFVLVQHLDPVHESALTEILSRATKLPVQEVRDSPRVQPDHIYIIPPNTFLSIEHGELKLEPRTPGRVPNRSVDHFFESLAQDVGERAIGVVLSGAANDGTLGLEAIRAAGGFTFAQDDSARYDSMPRSAIAAGCVDLVLSPKEIAEELARIAHHPEALPFTDGSVDPLDRPDSGRDDSTDHPTDGTVDPTNRTVDPVDRQENDEAALDRAAATKHEDDDKPLPSGGSGSPPTGANEARKEASDGSGKKDGTKSEKNGDSSYKKIMLLLHTHSGVDFSLYKSSTIRRRINRRIVLSRVETLNAYIDFLRGNSKELDALYTDVLISVTSFFRNPEAFDFLKKTVFPKIVPTGKDAVMRIWTLGCSTGQEAYSLAMLYMEYASTLHSAPKLQLFATDLNERLLEKARGGLYAKSIVNDISPERLRRFFVEEDGGYRVIKPLRESVVFARQNLLSDPPFSRMDLISCRNLLIYIESSLQKKVMPMFHYALKPKGCLFLGASESVGSFTDLFEPVDRKHKLFNRKPGTTPTLQVRLTPSRPDRTASVATITRAGEPEGFRSEVHTQREADRITRNRYAPPSVLINGDLLVVEFRGDTSPFLKPPTGQASFHLLKMAREGLMLPLRTAINKAKKDNAAVRKENIHIAQNGHSLDAHIEVVPLKNIKEPHYLVFFEDAAKPAPAGKAARAPHIAPHSAKNFPAKEQLRRIADLEAELAETRDYLQSMQEQHEAANEELQASSEEVTSANEELQSINEELETSKEELESANEELTTINDEMAGRNTELNRLNSDLNNLQASTHQAIVLLGRDLTIRRFSPQAEKQFHLLANDVGRPFGSIRHDLVIEGIATNGTGGSSAHGTGGRSSAPTTLEDLITQVIDTVRETEIQVRDRQGRWFSLRVRPYFTVDNKVDGAVLVLVDVNDVKTASEALRESRRNYIDLVQGMATAVYTTDAQGRILLFNAAAEELWGRAPEVGKDRWCGSMKIFQPDGTELPVDAYPMAMALRDGKVEQGQELVIERPDGTRCHALAYPQVLRNSEGTITGAVNSLVDITKRKRIEEERKQVDERYQTLFNTMEQGFCVIDMIYDKAGKPINYRFMELNPAFAEHNGLHNAEGKTMREFAPDMEEFWFETYGRVARTGKRTSFVHESKALGRWFEAEAFRVSSSTEQVGILFKDITARIQAEGRTAQLAAIVSSSHDAIISKDLHSIIQTWNHGAEELFGYTAEEAIGQPVTILMPPERVDEEPGILQRIVEGHVIDQYETIRQHKDGHPLEISLTISPIRNEEGVVIGASKIARDISSELRAAKEMRVSEQRYSDLFNTMDQGFCVIKLHYDVQDKLTDWTYMEVNPAFEKQSGLSHAAGKRASELMPGLEQHWFDLYDQVARTGEAVNTINKVQEMDRWLEVFAYPTGELADRQLGVLFRDITGRVRKERKIRKEAEQLRQQSDVLFEESAGLREESASLRMEDKHKNEFLATLAHELRNPLAPLRTGLEVLHEMQPTDSPGSEVATMMQRQVDQIVHLVDDLLDVSRIGSGKIILRKEPTDLCQAIHDAAEAIKPSLNELGQELVLDLPDQPVMLDGDPARLNQVVSNLLNNASKFSPDLGLIEIHAQVKHGEAVIRVVDHGEGLCADDLPRIFGLFNQTSSPGRLRENSGLGIGLTLVRDLVHLHAGTVEAHSDGLGKGCVFTVKLPVPEHLPEKKMAKNQPVATASTARKVLVVDDNEDAAQLLTLILSRKGHTVLSAFNGPEGLKVGAEFKPDLVLLDIGLPGMNGHEVAKLIRKAEWGKKLILIALTGWGQNEDKAKSKAAGFDHHLVKPVQVEKILELMKGAS